MVCRIFLIVVLLMSSSVWSQETGATISIKSLDARYRTKVSRQLADNVIKSVSAIGYSVEISRNGIDTLNSIVSGRCTLAAIVFSGFHCNADSCWVFSNSSYNPLFDSTIIFSEIDIQVDARHK